jgi:hypothetical protein
MGTSPVHRTPLEIWEMILQAATKSTLFPFIDGNGEESVLVGSIIPNIHLFGDSCHPFTLYARNQQTFNRLRRVCRVWNELLIRIGTHQKWAFTNLFNKHYPSFDANHPPQRVCIDGGYRSHICANNQKSCVTQMWRQSWNVNQSPMSVMDHVLYLEQSIGQLSHARIAILGSFPTRPSQLLDRMPSIQAVSINLFALRTTFSMADLELGISLKRLTHLQLHHIGGGELAICNSTKLDLSSIVYLSIRFVNAYLEPGSMQQSRPFDKWTLGRLQSLCIGGRMTVDLLEEIIPFLIRCGETITEFLLDICSRDWRTCPSDVCASNKFLRNLWGYLPHLSVLGFEMDALGVILFSIPYRHYTSSKPVNLFVLPPEESSRDAYSSTTKLCFSSAWQAFEGGIIDKIYFAESQDLLLTPRDMYSKPTKDSPLKRFIEYCLRYGLPVYDINGWQICSNRRIPWT